MENIKIKERISKLSEEERMEKIEEMIKTKQFGRRVEGILISLILFLISYMFFKEHMKSTMLYYFGTTISLVFLIVGNSNIHKRILKESFSNEEKIDAFIEYINSEIVGYKKNMNNDTIAIPIHYHRSRYYSSSSYIIQPILTRDRLDIFLINNLNLRMYKVPVDIWEYDELKRLFKTNIDEFNKEIELRRYEIKLYE